MSRGRRLCDLVVVMRQAVEVILHDEVGRTDSGDAFRGATCPLRGSIPEFARREETP
ncbi:MAG: hypothetical protein GY937_08145 [bacterium]|nr:hypothetical protein [bacterium]